MQTLSIRAKIKKVEWRYIGSCMSFDRSSQKHFAFHSVSMEDAKFVGFDEVFVLRKHDEYTGPATALKNLSRRYTGASMFVSYANG